MLSFFGVTVVLYSTNCGRVTFSKLNKRYLKGHKNFQRKAVAERAVGSITFPTYE